MKKVICLLLVLAMAIGMVGCSNNAGNNNGNGGSSDEVYEVVLKFPTMMTIPSDEAIKDVQDAINAYIKDELGITDMTLRIDFQSLFTYTTDINMGLASKEKMDIIFTGDLPTAVSNGYLTDLTPYLDNEMAGAKAVIKDWLDCGTINGTVYAIPCYKGQVLSWKYIYNKEYTDGVYDMTKVKSLEDLDECFAALKAAYPNEYFGVYTNQYPTLKCFEDHTSVIGTYFATVGDSTQLVNALNEYFQAKA